MRLRITLQGPGGSASEDVQITADATATAGDVASAIAGASRPPGVTASHAHLTLRILDGGPASARDGIAPDTSLLESGLRSGATVEVAPARSSGSRADGPTYATLRVLSGPDRGKEFSLRAGMSTIGRSASNDVPLRDASVSKEHARVVVGERIDVIDAGSSNGVIVGGTRVTRVPLGPGDIVLVGSTHFSITRTRATAGAESTSTDIPFTRSPRVLVRPEPVRIEAPEAPRPPARSGLPWLAMLAPLVLGIIMFAVTRNALSIAFIALSPILMLGSYFDQRRAADRSLKEAVATFWSEFRRAEHDIARAHDEERERLEDMYPRVSDCLASATRLGDLLWSRHPEQPEFLHVRLGTADIPSVSTVERPRAGGLPDLVARSEAFADANQVVTNAPVTADLRSAGGLGLCGGRSVLDGVVRAVVAQLIVLHSPAEVVVTCLTSTSGKRRWGWLEWLPHTASGHSPLPGEHLSSDGGTGRRLLAHLEELVEERRGGESFGEATPALPQVLVIVDEAAVDLGRLTRVAERGPDVGVHVLWVAPTRQELPAACRAYLDVSDGVPPSVGLVRDGRVISPVWVESVEPGDVAALSRTLAPVIDAGSPIDDDSDLPRSVPVVSLLGAELADDPQLVAARWRENGSLSDTGRRGKADGQLRAVVGHAGSEVLALDLRSQGPHALVGGTTGAGKSEFLQAWVLGLAHAYSPQRVTFLFVDYKGGAAFARCTELPHCVGLVTDLNPHLVRRVLRSLRAELVRRERLLEAKNAKDLLALEQSGDPDCPPSLVIVVDEFAALVGEVPEFVDGVVDVAQRGRSLGLHLILATQRPAGVIKDNLRANTNLRIALRMADEQDSDDVLGDPMAAGFEPSVPGRAAAKTGAGRIIPFQSAFPGARTPARPPAPPIEIVGLDFGIGRQWPAPTSQGVGEEVPTDIERLVVTIGTAAASAGLPPPRRPWLDALEPTCDLAQLAHGSATDDDQLVLGVRDDPDAQARVIEFFRPETDGNIAFIGAGGSGKSTALRSLVAAAALTRCPGSTHVYALDFGGGALASLSELPTVGDVVSGDDTERVGRLLRRLTQIVEERSMRYSALRASSLSEYRRQASRPDEPRVLLVLDGFAAFRNAYETAPALMASYGAFQRILVDGRAVGVHVAMTADRGPAVPLSVSSAFQRKVVLRQADDDGYLSLGVPRDVLDPSSPPGRAMQIGIPQELQLAVLGGEVSVAAQARLLERLAAQIRPQLPHTPEPVGALPSNVLGSSLPPRAGTLPVLGVEDESLEATGFTPEGVVLVAGPAQSGRTSTVEWVAHALRRAHDGVTLVHLSARRSPLSTLGLWTHTAEGTEACAQLATDVLPLASAAAPPGAPGIAVFVEGYPEFVGTPVETPLLELVKACRRNSHFLVAEGETTTWSSSWPLVTEARNARTGVLLQPDQMDGDTLLRTSLPARIKRTDFPPGRAFYLRAGRATKVQIPLADSEPSKEPDQPIDLDKPQLTGRRE